MQKYYLARKDITSVAHGIVVHGCNCSNGFGSGVALAIKKRWPEAERAYRHLMQDKTYPAKELLGTIQIIPIEDHVMRYPPSLIVVNGFTQLRYGKDKKRYADPLAIQSVLNKTLSLAKREDMDIYMPKIGCNLGGLSWEKEVEPIVATIAYKADLDGIRIVVCDPSLPVYKNEHGWQK